MSNTWLLEKEFDWHGICAEPNPKFFVQLQKNRSCITTNQYIAGQTGKHVEFITADVYGGSAEYIEEDMHSDKRKAYAAAGNSITVLSISLNDFLKQHKAPNTIDYISIDTEGSEYEILEAFPFDNWDIHLFTIEHNHTKRRDDIRKLLESHGYIYVEMDFDDWYEKAMTSQ